jgi:signal transduction histidine kinase
MGLLGTHTNRDGQIRWYETSKAPLVNANGEIFGILGTTKDITLNRQAEEEIRTLNTRLEQRVHERTQQLEIVNNELASTSYSIAHDLKTPLRALDGFSHILLEEYYADLDAQGREYLERIRKASHRLGLLSDDLLKILSITRSDLHFESLDLNLIAQDIIDQLHFLHPRRNVEFICNGSLVVKADARMVQILMENLINNAWKFTKKRRPASIELDSFQQDGKTVFFIRDNGVGFDMQYVEKLFGVFQRLHNSSEYEGTGIGLALAQRVVQRHGGSIWANSDPGKGAVFYFTL